MLSRVLSTPLVSLEKVQISDHPLDVQTEVNVHGMFIDVQNIL